MIIGLPVPTPDTPTGAAGGPGGPRLRIDRVITVDTVDGDERWWDLADLYAAHPELFTPPTTGPPS